MAIEPPHKERDEEQEDNSLESLQDILHTKLENAFHQETSTVILKDLLQIVSEHSAVDLAYAAYQLPPYARVMVYEHLSDISGKIQFLVNTDRRTRMSVFRHISNADLKVVLENMPPDDAVEVLEDFPERRLRRVIEMLDVVKAQRIQELEKHERNTAGRLMTNDFFSFSPETTIGEAALFIRNHPGIDLTREIFVVDQNQELLGVVPARNLIVNPPQFSLGQVMRDATHTVSPDTEREEVADLFERYKLLSLAVLSEEKKLLGVITQEDALDMIEDITDETIANMAGTTEKVSEHEALIKRFFLRAPWLVVTLLAGLVNMAVMSSFQEYVGPALLFALFFVPLITGMSGNIGIQCSTILVRGIAMGLVFKGNRKEAVIKELMVGLVTGVFFGVVAGFAVYGLDYFGISRLGMSAPAVGVIVGVGLAGACLAGTLLGVLSPIFFMRLGVDPAVASGPIVTAFNDFLSMSIYFLIAMGLAAFLL